MYKDTFTFVADGETKIFDFEFPFFEKTNVVITVDSKPAVNYNMVCIKNGLNADTPFCGGQVHFNKPPQNASIIQISRKLPIQRIVDYQPTAKYNSTIHNQDMNYVIEILKDMECAINRVVSLPTDAQNQQSISLISQQISQILSDIKKLRDKIDDNDTDIDLSEIYDSLDSLTDSIDTLNTQYNQLAAQIANLPTSTLPENADYVMVTQLPSATNNYTWYRKYKSGWVEQGGLNVAIAFAGTTINLPVTMQDKNYMICAIGANETYSSSVSTSVKHHNGSNTETSFTLASTYTGGGRINWCVMGLAPKPQTIS